MGVRYGPTALYASMNGLILDERFGPAKERMAVDWSSGEACLRSPIGYSIG
jgi:hypothetical protein